MNSWDVKPVTPSQPNARILRELSRNVSSLRNMRPVAGALGTFSLPWGQAVSPGNANWTVAYTSGGIPKATRNEDGSITAGSGQAVEAYPDYDDEEESLTIRYEENAGNPFPVYNIAYNDDGAVGAGRWIIVLRFWTFWVVIYEECPDTQS